MLKQFFHNKRLLLYGSGKTAAWFIKANPELQILGVLDSVKREGTFCELPVMRWEQISMGQADAVVIAASKTYIREIYFRIAHRCSVRNLEIYDFTGADLRHRFAFEVPWVESWTTLRHGTDELRQAIQSHDVISFDVFDTLVMRKTLEPQDIFDLTRERLRVKWRMMVPDFREQRIEAEYASGGGSINRIYRILQEKFGWSQDITDTVMREELACEKEHLIPRQTMVDLMKWACDLGKRVVLVTDMYLTSAIIRGLLDDLGITGFEKIYVSCEYGVKKENGLFQCMRREVGGTSFLHIGDNHQSDIVGALRCNIDAFEIKSARAMLSLSSIQKVLDAIRSEDDRYYAGNLIADVFNDPFVLSDTWGILTVRKVESFLRLCIIPLVFVYMYGLLQLLEEQGYTSLLFTSRDGFLFQKLYDSGVMGKPAVHLRSVYLICSRRLAWKATLISEHILDEFIRFYSAELVHPWKAAEVMFSDLTDVTWTGKNDEKLCQTIYDIRTHVFLSSEQTHERYLRYLTQLDIGDNPLFCDLNSQGTVQTALERLLEKKINGFYLQWNEGKMHRDNVHHAIYQESDAIGEYNHLLEAIFSSPDPSVLDISEDGSFVYAVESRSEDQLRFLTGAHNQIQSIICSLNSAAGHPLHLSPRFAEVLLTMASNILLTEEAEIIHQVVQKNDMGDEQTRGVRHFQ